VSSSTKRGGGCGTFARREGGRAEPWSGVARESGIGRLGKGPTGGTRAVVAQRGDGGRWQHACKGPLRAGLGRSVDQRS